MNLYMHTLDRKPAFYDGEQVVSAAGVVKQLVPSLRQLRQEQKASRAWRERQGFSIRSEYGYVRVVVET